MRALIVSYAFPPVGGAGVQRVLKLVKYLPEHGITPAVLTVANPSVPLSDHSLESDIPPGVEVLRTPTLEPGYDAAFTIYLSGVKGVTNLIRVKSRPTPSELKCRAWWRRYALAWTRSGTMT